LAVRKAGTILCIVTSSAPIDRVIAYLVFSCGGNIVTNKGGRLSPETVNTLVTLKENLELVDWGLGGG
jgi:hypothetical protein